MAVKYEFFVEYSGNHGGTKEIIEFETEPTEKELDEACKDWAVDEASFGYSYKKI